MGACFFFCADFTPYIYTNKADRKTPQKCRFCYVGMSKLVCLPTIPRKNQENTKKILKKVGKKLANVRKKSYLCSVIIKKQTI